MLYASWMHRWERRLTLRDTNRRTFPFEWGVEWLGNGNSVQDGKAELLGKAGQILRDSREFFRVDPPSQCTLEGDSLSFPSPAPGFYPENNRAAFRIFPVPDSKRAVLVVPQWNADAGGHVGLCRILQKLGITAVRMTLPYHEQRRPQGLKRADYMVSPNLGRTVHAVRQAVLEIMQMVEWLSGRGFTRIGVMGTSLGSCVAFLAFVHEPRLRTGVFNHVSPFFADVVWTGLSTRHVRHGLEGHISLEDLRRCWAPISPWHYIDRLHGDTRPHLLISARYDLSFLPELTSQVFQRYRECGIPVDRAELPCGHYTTAVFPFKYLDGWHICRYLRRRL